MPDDSQWCFSPDTVLPDEPPAWVQLLGEPFVSQWAELPKTKSAFDAAEEEILLENLDIQYDHEVLGQTGVPDDDPGPFEGGITQHADREVWQLLDALWVSRGETDPVATAIERLGQYHETTPPEYAAEADALAYLLEEHADEVARLIGRACAGLLSTTTEMSTGDPPAAGMAGDISELISDLRRILAAKTMTVDEVVTAIVQNRGIAKSLALSSLRTASKRRVTQSNRGEVRLLTRSIADYSTDELIRFIVAAMRTAGGPAEWDQDELTREVAKYLGFRRAGSKIQDAVKDAVRTGIRRGVLIRQSGMIRRV